MTLAGVCSLLSLWPSLSAKCAAEEGGGAELLLTEVGGDYLAGIAEGRLWQRLVRRRFVLLSFVDSSCWLVYSTIGV